MNGIIQSPLSFSFNRNEELQLNYQGHSPLIKIKKAAKFPAFFSLGGVTLVFILFIFAIGIGTQPFLEIASKWDFETVFKISSLTNQYIDLTSNFLQNNLTQELLYLLTLLKSFTSFWLIMLLVVVASYLRKQTIHFLQYIFCLLAIGLFIIGILFYVYSGSGIVLTEKTCLEIFPRLERINSETNEIYDNLFCREKCPCGANNSSFNMTITKNGPIRAQDCRNFTTNYSLYYSIVIGFLENYNCSGICRKLPYEIFSDVNSGLPESSCGAIMLQGIRNYFILIGCMCLVTAIIWFVILGCKFLDKIFWIMPNEDSINYGSWRENQINSIQKVIYQCKEDNLLLKNLQASPTNYSNLTPNNFKNTILKFIEDETKNMEAETFPIIAEVLI